MSQFTDLFQPKACVVLDGGMGTTLEDAFQIDISHTALWSAKPIDQNPEAIIAAHLAFLRAGARIISTTTYQCAFETFARAGYSATDARRLMHKSVSLADEARRRFAEETQGVGVDDVKIALSLGPFGATLSPTQEFDGYYPPPYGPRAYTTDGVNRNAFDENEAAQEAMAVDALTDFHLQRLRVFANDLEVWTAIDCVAFETVPLVREIEAIKAAMKLLELELGPRGRGFDRKPWWISTVYPEGRLPQEARPGGEKLGIRDVMRSAMLEKNGDVSQAVDRGEVPDGVGINCTGMEHLRRLLPEAERAAAEVLVGRPKPWLVIYPNGGDTYDPASRTWRQSENSSPKDESWAGALTSVLEELKARDFWAGIIVGGCCKVGPKEIQALVRSLRE